MSLSSPNLHDSYSGNDNFENTHYVKGFLMNVGNSTAVGYKPQVNYVLDGYHK